MMERVEQRVLGALRLVDHVTQVPVERPLTVDAGNARLQRNRSGLYVIAEADGLASHSAAFQTPSNTPTLATIPVSIDVTDPKGRYLPRRITVQLPRDPDPTHADMLASLFRPVEATLYPASTATVANNWSTIRVTLTQDSMSAPGALLRVIDEAEGDVLASGISDERGEALVIVPGVPITKFANDEDVDDGGPGNGNGHGHDDDDGEPPVMVTTLPVRLEISLGVTTTWPVDPDVLEQNHAANLQESVSLTLKTGRMEKVAINLT